MNVDKMNYAELMAMRGKIDAALPKAREDAKAAARAAVEKTAKAAGFTVAELAGGKRGRPRKAKRANGAGKPRKAPQRMRDPQSGVIWAGRGRVPANFERARAVAV